MANNDTSTSKLLSLVLRHKPEAIGISLDAQGWIGVDELLHAMQASGKQLTRAELERIVETNEKQRFAFSPDGRSIRANQGHSIQVDLKLVAQVPPPKLYHGTANRFLESILVEGLKPGARHHVHLSSNIDVARSVGARHGKPVILVVESHAMHASGHSFYRSANGVWLTDLVPVFFLSQSVD